ncbi:hypothetical protein EON66_11820, partial [archaeon]
PSEDPGHGEGMTAYFTSEPQREVGPVLGNQAKYNGLGLFVDTYNHILQGGTVQFARRPIIALVANDGTDIVSDDEYTTDLHEPALCYADVLHSYDATHELATIRLQVKGSRVRVSYFVGHKATPVADVPPAQWKSCIDVTMPSYTLPKQLYFSASATTGMLSDHHDLYGLVWAHNGHPDLARFLASAPATDKDDEPDSTASHVAEAAVPTGSCTGLSPSLTAEGRSPLCRVVHRRAAFSCVDAVSSQPRPASAAARALRWLGRHTHCCAPPTHTACCTYRDVAELDALLKETAQVRTLAKRIQAAYDNLAQLQSNTMERLQGMLRSSHPDCVFM